MSMWSNSYSAIWQVAKVSPMALSRMCLSRMCLTLMSLSPMFLPLMSLSPMFLPLLSLCLRRAWMDRYARSEPGLILQRRRAFGLKSGSCLVSLLCCNLFISGTEEDTCGGVVFVWVRVAGFFVSFVLICLSQPLIITPIARFLDWSGCIFYLLIVLWDIAHAVFLQLLA
jgi:hypothetical protein